VRSEGLEPPTYKFVACCSIQLSYDRTQYRHAFMPATRYNTPYRSRPLLTTRPNSLTGTRAQTLAKNEAFAHRTSRPKSRTIQRNPSYALAKSPAFRPKALHTLTKSPAFNQKHPFLRFGEMPSVQPKPYLRFGESAAFGQKPLLRSGEKRGAPDSYTSRRKSRSYFDEKAPLGAH